MLSKRNTKLKLTAIVALCITMHGCSEYLSYSIFDTNIKTQHYNAKNIEALQNVTANADTLKFAFFSDSHDNYDELSELIHNINKQTDIQFIISGGDICNFGLTWEFEKYLILIKKFKRPIITAIGNHDHVSNGIIVYKRIFGANNFTFTYNNYKFIIFDDVVWENNGNPPNFEWLNKELENSSGNILVSHIPPWDTQIDSANNQQFKQIITKSNTALCLHGHTHNYKEIEYNSIHTLVAGDLKDREYYIITITNGQALTERIYY